ncbi:MAG: DivIVA domain-containing protein [Bifidobacteriaceae bacterium]|jgi:DivIVA domain-containing protein|nr:DivIVA domain-containing protein [Bifidobacteriaceae bacterium]
MAQLTADDVVLKGFQTTKFREGYDQVEVDDFLDEVAMSMRAMAAEAEELKSQLAAAEARIAELEQAGPGAPEVRAGLPGEPPAGEPAPGFGLPGVPPVPAPPAPPAQPALPVPPAAPSAPSVPSVPGVSAPGQPGAPVGGPVVGPVDRQANEAETATGMLALANKLHQEYVRAGQEESDQMIAEAKAQAATIVREAEENAARTKGRLEQERVELEKEIETLRIFERDYRTRLRTYLQNLLSDIDGASPPGTPDAVA